MNRIDRDKFIVEYLLNENGARFNRNNTQAILRRYISRNEVDYDECFSIACASAIECLERFEIREGSLEDEKNINRIWKAINIAVFSALERSRPNARYTYDSKEKQNVLEIMHVDSLNIMDEWDNELIENITDDMQIGAAKNGYFSNNVRDEFFNRIGELTQKQQKFVADYLAGNKVDARYIKRIKKHFGEV